jgi:hypothetical protein
METTGHTRVKVLGIARFPNKKKHEGWVLSVIFYAIIFLGLDVMLCYGLNVFP